VLIDHPFKAFFPRPRMTLKLAFGMTIATLASIARAQTTAGWRYDLRPGDRLVYSYIFHREVRSDEAETAVEARFHTQVLVASDRGGVFSAASSVIGTAPISSSIASRAKTNSRKSGQILKSE
jgi:hypothetical protein